jgi:hypothetical protein
MRCRSEDGPAEPVGGDPFADIFFTLAAVVLIALVAASLTSAPPRVVVAEQAGADVSEIFVLNAGRAGVTMGDAPLRVVAIDAILTDAALRSKILAAKAAGRRLALVIARDGLDAAFQLESLLGDLGVAQVAQAREP